MSIVDFLAVENYEGTLNYFVRPKEEFVNTGYHQSQTKLRCWLFFQSLCLISLRKSDK